MSANTPPVSFKNLILLTLDRLYNTALIVGLGLLVILPQVI